MAHLKGKLVPSPGAHVQRHCSVTLQVHERPSCRRMVCDEGVVCRRTLVLATWLRCTGASKLAVVACFDSIY